MIHSIPYRNSCRLYIQNVFTYSVGPSRVVWSELGSAPPFPPMRVLEVSWSRARSFVCEVALRVSSHTRQEPWPCNGEDPWLSSKGCTMDVGKAVLCSLGPSKHSVKWEWTMLRDHYIFVGEKRGDNSVHYNMSQTLSIWENYLVMFVYPKIYIGIYHATCPTGNSKKNSWSLEKFR